MFFSHSNDERGEHRVYAAVLKEGKFMWDWNSHLLLCPARARNSENPKELERTGGTGTGKIGFLGFTFFQ